MCKLLLICRWAVGTETVLWAARYSKCDLAFSQTTEIIAEISLIGPLGRREREVEGVGGGGGVIKPLKLYFKLWIYCSESDSGPFRGEVLSSYETGGTWRKLSCCQGAGVLKLWP